MGENNSKSNNGQRVNLQNIQGAHAAQYQKNKQLNQKVDRRPKQTFLRRRHNKHMKRCLKLLITKEMQKKKNYNEVSSRISRMGIIKKSTNIKCGEKGPILHSWWECKLMQPLWRRVCRFL